MRAFLLDIGAGSITVDQCTLEGHDANNNLGARKSTTVVCDARLAPHLQHQLGGFRSDISDDAFKRRHGGDTWRGAEAEIYPPELNRRIAITISPVGITRKTSTTKRKPSNCSR